MQALPSKGFPVGLVVRNPLANVGDVGSVPASGRSPREGNGNPLQYSCLGNAIDRGTWFGLQFMGSKKSWTQLATKQQMLSKLRKIVNHNPLNFHLIDIQPGLQKLPSGFRGLNYLDACCPVELSAVMFMFYMCAGQFGCHQPHPVTENLKCSWYN